MWRKITLTSSKNIHAVNSSIPEEYFWSTALFWLEELSFETGDCPVKTKQNIFLYSTPSTFNIISILLKNKLNFQNWMAQGHLVDFAEYQN